MNINITSRVSKARLDELRKTPRIRRLRELGAKMKSGQATTLEARELDELTGWAKKLPKNRLSESHRPAADV